MTRCRQQARRPFRRNAAAHQNVAARNVAVRLSAVSVCRILLFASLLGISRVAVGDGKPAGSASTAGPKATPRASGTSAFAPGVLNGQVVLADGKPAADAKVWLRGKNQRETRTDGQGRFRIESLAPGRYVVWAVKENLVSPTHSSLGRSIVGVQGGRFEPVRLELGPGKRIDVLVTSAKTGSPLPGARVRNLNLGGLEQKTGTDGRLKLEPLAPGVYYISFGVVGYAGSTQQIDLRGSADSTEFIASLNPGGVIRVVVVDDKGQPLENVNVSCFQFGSPLLLPPDSPLTDAKGRFRRDFLPLDTSLFVSARKEGYLPQQQTVSLSPKQPEADLTIKLTPRPRGGAVAGVVRDEKGKPIAGASVENLGDQTETIRKTITDRAGNYLLDDLFESDRGYELLVRASGRCPSRLAVKPGSKGKPATLDVMLEPGHSVQGRVVAEDGKPVAEVEVRPHRRGSPWLQEYGRQTDQDGRFEIDSLPHDVRFQISKRGYTALRDVSLRLDTDAPATIVLQPAGMIRGQVVDAQSGQPLNHFSVWLDFARQGRRQNPGNFEFGMDLNYPGRRIASKDGMFVIDNVANGLPAEVGVAADGYLKLVQPLVVAAAPPDDAKPVRFALARLDPSRLVTVSGRILDHASRPASRVNLRLIISSGPLAGPNNLDGYLIKTGQLGGRAGCDQFLKATSNPQGDFAFKGVLANKHWQLAYWGEHVPMARTEGEDTHAGQALSITLVQTARISGTIDRAKYAHARSVRLTPKKGAFDWQVSDVRLSDGQSSFEFRDVPPGDFVVSLQSNQNRPRNGAGGTLQTLASQPIEVKAGESLSVRF
jgi:Carboxypeptidase regulatory-like domain